MNLYESIKTNLVESDSSFDVEGLADRIDILMSGMDPYEHMDVYGSSGPTEESYQDTLDSLYNNPQSVLDSISSYDIIDWEDDIQTEYNEVIQDLKKWIGLSKKNEAEEPGDKGYWVKIKMKNNKQVLHLFNTEDDMREYLNLLSHYVGQGEVEILDYTGKDSKKNESEYVVYTTTEIKPGEFKSDIYGKYDSSDQAEDIVAELKAKGINATMSLDESESWLTSKDIDWLSTQGHLPNLNKLSMNYKATGDIETDEHELDDIASNYFYDDVGIYNENIDSLCTKWAHDQAVKINKAFNESEGTESVDEDDEYKDSNYKVDTSGLVLTNGGYHNNSNVIYGRVQLYPKDKSSSPGIYELIYFCEDGHFYLFDVGSDVQGAVNWLYTIDGTNDDEWIKWNGSRVQLKDFWSILVGDALKDVSSDQRDAIETAVNKAYFDEEPVPLNKVNYD